MSKLVVPEGYRSVLSVYETQTAISGIKKLFEDNLSKALNLRDGGTLSGCEAAGIKPL